MKKFDKHIAAGYINGLCTKHKIKIYAWSKTSCGLAYVKERRIKIPTITNVDRFGVALHEVCHVIQGKVRPRYLSEFRCDLYALQHLRGLGYETTEWEKRMNWHTLSRVAMAHNRGLKTIVQEVRIYFNHVNWDAWKGHKVFVYCVDAEPLGYKIELTKNLTSAEITKELAARNKTLNKSFNDDSTYGKWLVKDHNQPYPVEYENLSEIVRAYDL